MRAPNVFSIPASAPFLATFVDALVSGRLVPGFVPDLDDPMALADVTIYLPTRRAARALSVMLADQAGRRPVILPRIVPLGDIGEAEIELVIDGALLPENLKPAIPDAARRLILTSLVLTWARALAQTLRDPFGHGHEPLLVPASPADALALAGDLARLMDDLSTREVDWSALRGAIDERHDAYFGITADFMRLASEVWPAILAERDALDPAIHRDLVRRAQAARMAGRSPGSAPVIAAGSTGTVPSTAMLLSAIASAPGGALVLPDVDTTLAEADIDAILGRGEETFPAHTHPQAAILRLLDRIGIAPADVVDLAKPSARMRLVREVMRPAATTVRWTHAPLPAATLDQALERVAVVEAEDEREEALAVAVAIRETLAQDEAATVALVTPDRVLADRVCAELRRWRIETEDSSGQPLSRMPSGILAQLVADAAASDFAPVPILALIHHPLARFGFSEADMVRARGALELLVLRGPAPPVGRDGLAEALKAACNPAREKHRLPRPVRRLTGEDERLAAELVARIERMISLPPEPGDLLALVPAHLAACEAVASDDEGTALLDKAPDGNDLQALFDDLMQTGGVELPGRLADYPAFFTTMARERVVRPRGTGHRRVKIWGLLEARLLDADRIIAGGLVETVWPPAATTDAFLNRPMRHALQLALPEQRIGQTAHDFVAAMGARDVVLTRARRRESKPTIPARFLERLRAYIGDDRWTALRERGEAYRQWAAALDDPPAEPPLPRPSPKPPADLQPTSLSVTQIETLIRDPYAIFARTVLKLDPLEAVATPPGARDRGTIVHAIFARAAREVRGLPRQEQAERMRAIGRDAFQAIRHFPDVEALWWPRFESWIEPYLEWEATRLPAGGALLLEESGALALNLPDGSVFTLRARADRIEIGSDGVTVLDFKTGSAPGIGEVAVGFAPQLTLQAGMVRQGAFTCGQQQKSVAMAYVKPAANAFVETPIVPGKTVFDPQTLPGEHLDRLVRLLAEYRAGHRGFTSRPFVKYLNDKGDYDHLARVREWASAGEEGS